MNSYRRLLLGAILAAVYAHAQTGSPSVVISQVYGGGGNSGATLKNDFIELFNRGDQAVDLTGWSVRYSSATGTEWLTTPLHGMIAAGGYYLIQEAAGAGGTVSLPSPDASGEIAMSATSGKVDLVAPALAAIDLVGYGPTASAFERTPAPVLTNTTAAVRKSAGCMDTGDNSADFATGQPLPRNTATPIHSCATGVFAASLSINQIQGASEFSPYKGQPVVTSGIVTALRNNGFYLQSAEGEADTDPETSEGIFVFTSSAPPPSAVRGAKLRVLGTVAEFVPASDLSSPSLTEIVDPQIEVLSISNPLPAPVAIGPTTGDLERYEGMRVSVPSLIVTGPTGGSVNETAATASSNGAFYGVIGGSTRFFTIAGPARPYLEPGIRTPENLPAGTPAEVPRYDGNPERLRIDSRSQGGPAVEVTSGAVVRNIAGPLDYGFRTYTILQDVDAPLEVSGNVTMSPIPVPTAQEFTIASMNLQRLFDDKDDPLISDAVPTTAAYQARLAKIARVIKDVLQAPDVIGVEEVENIEVLRALASVAGGYEAFLVEGNDIGGIDVGFLVKTSRVKVIDVKQEGKNATYTVPGTGARELTNDRPPLVLRAQITQDSGSPFNFTVVVNHLRSLTSIETEARVRAKRQAQALFLANLIQARQLADPAENIISIGDYNAFQFNDGYADVIGTIKGTPAPASQVVLSTPDVVNPDLLNLTDTLPMDQNYSYVFGGNTQTLEHILVNENLRRRLSRYVIARNNADFPETYRNDSSRTERISDHDNPVAYFTFSPATPQITAAGVTNAATGLSGAVSPGEIVDILGSGIGPDRLATLQLSADGQFVTTSAGGTRVLFNGLPAPIIFSQTNQIRAIVPFEITNRTTTDIQVEFQGRATNKIIVPVSPSAPGIFSLDASSLGPGAVLNQDNSVNSAAKPAARGSVVVLYATGAGQTNAEAMTGRITTAPLATQTQTISARIGQIRAEVLYAGPAPGLVSGVLQINLRVPVGTPAGSAIPVDFTAGGRASAPGITLAVQ
ncbi:MAG TPA: lamin tail domain-containing protein [Bryobacteraceae bacterium]|nr:lamin tail domain-containing protein [Bryobacteraceae bacterium]